MQVAAQEQGAHAASAGASTSWPASAAAELREEPNAIQQRVERGVALQRYQVYRRAELSDGTVGMVCSNWVDILDACEGVTAYYAACEQEQAAEGGPSPIEELPWIYDLGCLQINTTQAQQDA